MRSRAGMWGEHPKARCLCHTFHAFRSLWAAMVLVVPSASSKTPRTRNVVTSLNRCLVRRNTNPAPAAVAALGLCRHSRELPENSNPNSAKRLLHLTHAHLQFRQ